MAYTILVVLITLAVVVNVQESGCGPYIAGTGLIVLGFLVMLLH